MTTSEPADHPGRVLAHAPLPPRRGMTRSTTWWGKAWVRALEEAAYDDADLRAGRALARAGSVGGLSLAPGRVVAAVADGEALLTVDVGLPVLDAAQCEALVETVAAESGRVGALLAGELPHELVEHAEETGVELLPYGGELSSSCTCDAWVDPCAHGLAVLQQVCWLVEADPTLLLHLRGLPRDELLARLHERTTSFRSGDPPDGLDPEDAALLDLAQDAALRAARLLAVLEADPDAPVSHLL